uniref:C1q domain-containing protein n=1 Tax=Oryzias melastigma TaxID=30732 RepID=A0A3B3CM81_ORYME
MSLMDLWRKLNRSESLQDQVNTEMEERLRAGEKQLDDLQTQRSDVELRLRSTETHLEQLEAHTAALEVTLRVREEQLEHLDSHTSDQISSIESRLTDGLNRTADVELRLRSTETHLEQLEAHTAGKSFSLCHSSLMQSFWSLWTLCCSALEVTLRVREEQLEHLDSHTSDQISSIESRLTDGLNRTADQISSIESRLTDGLNRTADVELRLRSTETHLEQLEAHTAVFTLRLNVTEQLLDELQTESAVRAADLRSVSDGLTEAQEELQVRLGAVAAAVEELNTEGGGKAGVTTSRLLPAAPLKFWCLPEELRVGFSAGLTDSGVVGPFDQETTLVFSKTIINVGHAYNQSAGVFTAPVGGVYFFSFTAADYLKGYMGLHLYRNEQPVFFSLELNDHGGYASSCSSVALQLERGDRVRLSLPASYRLYDDSRNFSVFSGFLLFPL